MKVAYLKDGFCFQPAIKGRPVELPLTKLHKSILRDSEWTHLNALEQIYYQGLLEPVEKGYLLKPGDFFELDTEMTDNLPVPHNPAEFCLEENGNVGSAEYNISWYLLLHGQNAGRSVRRGCVASAAGIDFVLTPAQFRLIKELEDWKDTGVLEDRARFQAKCKYLAERADVKLSKFTQNREFLFADQVQPNIRKEDDHSLRIVPKLPEIPEEISEALPDKLKPITQTRQGGKSVSIFTTHAVEKQYNDIAAIPPISGQDIPRFAKNPLSFLPESIEFDAEDFSKRVKGLKIRTARAVPFIRIEKQENAEWFPASYGTNITDDGTDDSPEKKIELTPELEELLRTGAEKGEEYIYYQGTWIKIDPEQYGQHLQLRNELSDNDGQGHGAIRKAQATHILDIYQNLEGIEYNESQIKENEETHFRPYPIPRSLQCTLKDYQVQGYSFIRGHYEAGTGVLLADDMGLGKTVQIISFLSYLFDENQLSPALLVMPLSLIENWCSEMRKFLPAVAHIYVHQGNHRYRSPELIENNEVVMTSYETLARDQELLGRIRWSCVVCDEVQKVKNFHTLAASAVKGMNTSFRIAVTGTPVENRLSELWSIVDFVQPGLLGSYKVFRKTYEAPIQKGAPEKEERVKELIDEIAPVFLRRKKEDVLAGHIPEKTDEIYPIAMCSPQRELYCKILRDREEEEKNCALGTIQKLMMLCSHPRLITKEMYNTASASALEKESPKLAWTMEQLHEIKRKKEKVIIFTRYLAMQSILRQAIFEEFKIDAPIINGQIKDNRLSIIHQFEASKGFNIMILSPKAAGVGLNIVAANHVIHYTREWNPAIENQATDRAYRIGQTKPVFVYYPVMECPQFSTVEERLNDLLKDKREIMKNVIIPTDLEVTAEDFYDLLGPAS